MDKILFDFNSFKIAHYILGFRSSSVLSNEFYFLSIKILNKNLQISTY